MKTVAHLVRYQILFKSVMETNHLMYFPSLDQTRSGRLRSQLIVIVRDEESLA